MHWYGGSIAEAVTLSKQKNAIFVVFVEGDNDLSVEMSATIDDAAVVSRLSNQANFLAVKLKSGTTNYTHFAQIYQFVPVPSLFFIGRNGTPLEVVCAGVQPDNLATRIDRILAEHHGEKPPPLPQPSTSSSNQGINATVGMLQSEAKASTPITIPGANKTSNVLDAPSPPKIPKPSNPETTQTSGKDYEVVCDGDVCVRRPKNGDQPSTSHAAAVTPAVPLATPTVPLATPTVPLATPTVPLATPAVPLAGPTVPLATPAVPLVTPTAPVIPGTNVAARVPQLAESSSSEISVDEKLERAKELIEAKRKEKIEQEKELERQKELERRNTGQGVAELKKWQADQEMKQLQEDRKREKLENNLARQRILEQIAQDRAERKARDTTVPLTTPIAGQTSHLPTSGDAGTSARVQFKLPDGSSHSAHFDATGTLGDVQRYVSDNLQLSASSFALWTAFPRRELTETTATLRELSLAPSAALLVLPRRTTAAPDVNKQPARLYAFISQLLTTLLYQPSLALYTWLRTRLFPPPAVSPRPPAPPGPPTGPSTGPVPRAGPLPRRRTNIHRLPGDAANDDDNNTWNGNSTQQM